MTLKTDYVDGDVVAATDLNAITTAVNGAIQSGGSLAGCTGLPVGGIDATGISSSAYLKGDGTWETPAAGVTTGKAIAMAIVFG